MSPTYVLNKGIPLPAGFTYVTTNGGKTLVTTTDGLSYVIVNLNG